jgi:hypothetical protein
VKIFTVAAHIWLESVDENFAVVFVASGYDSTHCQILPKQVDCFQFSDSSVIAKMPSTEKECFASDGKKEVIRKHNTKVFWFLDVTIKTSHKSEEL